MALLLLLLSSHFFVRLINLRDMPANVDGFFVKATPSSGQQTL